MKKNFLAIFALLTLVIFSSAYAASPFTGGRVRFFTNFAAGDLTPLSGGLVYTYQAGTTTPKATFNTSVGDVENTNPVILDAEGYADIYLGSGNYKIDVKTSAGVSLPGYPVDNIEGTVFLIDTITASSSTAMALAIGEKIFEIEANKSLPVNSWVLISYDGDPADNYMIGQVTDYTGTMLTVDVVQIEGSGTYNDWTIALSGPPGPDGPQGATGEGTGDMLAANNLSELTATAATARGNIGLGSAAVLDVGTTANKVLQLNSDAKIPAVDGSLVTSLNASALGSGTVPTARLGSGTATAATVLFGNSTWGELGPVAANGVGAYTIAKYTGSNLTMGSTTSGSSLQPVAVKWSVSGENTDFITITLGSALTGTWRLMTYNLSSSNGNIGLFQRTE
jgi:hypothetical protein